MALTMLKLEETIDAAEGREIKRAMAVKMVLLGFKTKDICGLIGSLRCVCQQMEDYR